MSDGRDLIDAMRRNFAVELVASAEALHAAQQLRYHVFCHQRNILPGHDGIECDEYDTHSRHIVLRHRESGRVVGTARVITPSADSWPRLPMQRVCDPALLRRLPLATTGEISRFAVSRDRRASDGKSDLLLRLGLMQGILRVSRELGLTHWCAGMEPSLLRLLRTAGVDFDPLGPLVEYHGLRQPAVAVIDHLLAAGRYGRPAIWNYVTASGELAHDPEASLRRTTATTAVKLAGLVAAAADRPVAPAE